MRPLTTLLLTTLTLLLLAGCADKPTRLYVLSATTQKPASTSTTGVAIGVGPVTLPKYLDRPQIVTRVETNSLDQANFDQWGGDLNDNITRVMATNLSNLLATDRVSIYPWKDGAPIDYQITLDVSRFEQDKDGSVVLNVFWSIVNGKDNTVLLMRRGSYTQPGIPPGSSSGTSTTSSTTPDNQRPFDAQAGAMSRDLAALSKDVAAAITQLAGTS
jgi:uncharacterized lipoprotein YmbA